LYLTVLVIIYIGFGPLSEVPPMIGPGEEARPVVGMFKCSWLNLGASLTGSCRVRTGGLRVSMRFIGPEEGGVVAVSRIPGPGLIGVLAAVASPSDAAFPSVGGGEGQKDDGGYSGI
jgi:hypothetical protein